MSRKSLATFPHPFPQSPPLLKQCLPLAAPGPGLFALGARGTDNEGQKWRSKKTLHLYKVSTTIQDCRLWQMEAIQGRGLARAQLTTSGVWEEGDMDQDPCLYREWTSELQGRGRPTNLYSCLSGTNLTSQNVVFFPLNVLAKTKTHWNI